MTAAAALASKEVAAGAAAAAPTRTVQLANVVVFQAAWFGAVLGAAHGAPGWGTAGIVAAVGWHLAVSARPGREARLVGAACAIGLAVESAVVLQGHVAYPSGQPVAWLAPYWMVALWGLLAIAPNVTLRWLKSAPRTPLGGARPPRGSRKAAKPPFLERRPVLAALLGAVGGPLSFLGGVRLGGATLLDAPPALATLAVTWAVLLPTLMWLADRFDGVTLPPPERPHG